MSVVGNWTLHYSWGCNGSYTPVGITFNSNGTFAIPTQNLAGTWVQSEGMILWQFNASKTTYGGNIAGNSMTGSMSAFSGSNGCWYAIRVGSTIVEATKAGKDLNASGEKLK